MATDRDDLWHATNAMITYGGSFVQGLGRLFQLADADNVARLLAAFPEYVAEYREMARARLHGSVPDA